MKEQVRAHERIRLLVIAESRLFRECLVAKFAEAGLEVTPSDWDYAPVVTQRCRPTVALLSARLPSARVAHAAEELGRQDPRRRLVLLDERPRPAALRWASQLPVHGYWSQQTGFADLLEAVARAAAGHWVCCSAVADCLQWKPEGPHFLRWPPNDPLARLSPRERQVLALLAGGLRVKEIAERLGLAVNTVENHKARLLRKLSLHKSVDAVRLAIGQGLVEE